MAKPAETVEAPQPSLPQLLALDKDYSRFSDRLAAARRLAGLRSTASLEAKPSTNSPDIVCYNARAEWVLRWLLEKLRKDDDLAQDARGTPESWRLLRDVIDNLPISTAAKQLHTGSFLASFSRALKESFEYVAFGSGPVAAQAPELTNGSAKPEKSGKKSKKRKREGTPVEEVRPELETPTQLFAALVEVISCVAHKAQSSGDAEDIPRTHMRNNLRTDSQSAASLFSYWLKALQVVDYNVIGQLKRPGYRTSSPFCLAALLEIWRLRKGDAAPKMPHVTDFAQTCFMSLMSVLGRLSIQSELPADDLQTFASELRAELVKLALLEILLPARATYVSAGLNEEPAENTLARLFSPIAEAARSTAPETNGTSHAHHTTSVRSAVQLIWKECLSNVPRKTPPQRARESRWLARLFEALCDCILCPLDKSSDPRQRPDRETLKSLLSISMDLGYTPDEKLLTNILLRYSIDRSGDDSWDFDLISLVARMKPTILRLQNTKFEEALREEMDRYSHSLIQALGNVSASDDRKNDDAVVTGVLIPMMQAFAATRDLEDFLEIWRQQLELSFSSEAGGEIGSKEASIWQSLALSRALSSLLETSLASTEQLASLLRRLKGQMDLHYVGPPTSPVREAVARHRELSAVTHAALYMLNVCVGAINSSETLDELLIDLESLYDAAVLQCGGAGSEYGLSLAKCWRLLSTLWLILWPRAPSAHLIGNMTGCSAVTQTDMLLTFTEQSSQVPLPQDAFYATFIEAFQHAVLVASRESKMRETAENSVYRVVAARVQFYSKVRAGLMAKTTAKWEPISLLPVDYQIFSVLAEYPSVFSDLNMDLCIEVGSLMFHQAVKERSVEHGEPASQKWVSLLQAHIDASLDFESRQYLITTLCHAFEGPAENRDIRMATAAELLLRIPPATIPRQKRESILDGVVLAEWLPTASIARPVWLLLARIVEESVATAKVSTDADYLWQIAQRFSAPGVQHEDLICVVKSFMHSILHNLAQTKEQARSKDMFKYLWRKWKYAESVLKHSVGHLLLFGALVDTSFSYNMTMKADVVARCDTVILEQICILLDGGRGFQMGPDMGTSRNEDTLRNDALYVQEALSVLGREDDQLNKRKMRNGLKHTYTKFEEDIHRWRLPIPASLPLRIARLTPDEASSSADGQYGADKDTQKLVTVLRSVFSDAETSTDEAETRLTAVAIRDIIKGRTPSQRTSLLIALATPAVDSSISSHTDLQLTLLLLPHLERLPSDSHLTSSLISATVTLARALRTSTHDPSTTLLANILSSLLTTKPFLATQDLIDTLLASIDIAAHSPPSIYILLCNLLRTIISLHRARLHNRWHLVIPTIQRLMAALHTLATPQKPYTYEIPHAAALSRVLVTLCSPTPSSVARPHKRNKSSSLTDETVKAKQAVAPFLHSLLTSFCQDQLDGRLGPGLRSALSEGLFEGITVVGTEGREVINAGMTGGQRGVWRGLVGEWRGRNGERRE